MNKVTIQGKEYPYKFTIQALLDFQDKFDKKFQDIHLKGKGLGLDEMISIVYSCLKSGAILIDKELDISEDKFPHLLDMGELADLMSKIMKNDIPKQDDKKK